MSGGSAGDEWGYRPHLDGLRALAVYLVVAFHSGAYRMLGGFIGVDVFFVLSGYLVTHILLRDLNGSGKVRLARFYSRRVRRLLPAAVVNLAVTAVVFAAIASPVEAANAVDAIRSAALYVSNWFFIRESADYFASDISSSPVVHYWSLSVEEQFYLIWPHALGGVYALGRRAGNRQATVVRTIVLVAGVASLVTALIMARTDPNRAYLGTYTRAYQLLAGAFLALTPAVIEWVRRRSAIVRALPIASVGLLAGIVVLATSVVEVGPITRGTATTVTTVALIVALEAASGGIGRKILSSSPIVYLGRISYGTYLWHWLVILVIIDAYDPSPLFTFAIAAAVATGIASLSYQLLEQPIRIAPVLDRFKGPAIASGLIASILVGVLFAPEVLQRSSRDADANALAGSSGVNGTPNDANWQAAVGDNYEFGDCLATLFECPLTRGEGKKVVIVGDSHATMITPMLVDLAERRDLSLYGGFLLACPWTRGVRYAIANSSCFDHQQKIFDEVIPSIDPDIVILSSRPVDDPRNGVPLIDQDAGALEQGSQAQQSSLRSRITDLIRDLRADGREVLIVEPIPVPEAGHDPLVCLSDAKFLETCRFVVPTNPSPEERIIRDVAGADDGVWSIDLDPLICPYLPICDPVVNGHVVRPDDNHVTITFGRTLVDPFEQFLDDNGILG